MGYPRTNKEIIIIRQGGKTPQYDENSRKIFTCIWEEVEHFYCVDHAPTSRGAESDATTTHKLEGSRQLETFYFSAYNQPHGCSFDLKHGYYIVQRIGTRCNYTDCPDNVGFKFWKVVAHREYEILDGCWDFKITGERLVPRESEQLLLECKPYIKQLQGIVTNENH